MLSDMLWLLAADYLRRLLH